MSGRHLCPQQDSDFLAKPPFGHHWVLPDQDGKLHYLDRFEVLLRHGCELALHRASAVASSVPERLHHIVTLSQT